MRSLWLGVMLLTLAACDGGTGGGEDTDVVDTDVADTDVADTDGVGDTDFIDTGDTNTQSDEEVEFLTGLFGIVCDIVVEGECEGAPDDFGSVDECMDSMETALEFLDCGPDFDSTHQQECFDAVTAMGCDLIDSEGPPEVCFEVCPGLAG